MSSPIVITISADTTSAVARLQNFFNNMNHGIARLGAAGQFLETLGAQIAAAFTVTSLVHFTRETINLQDELGKLSQRVGVAVDLLDALRRQGEVNDVTFQDMSNGLRFLNDRIFAAVKQGGQAAQVFRDLNIALTDSAGSLRPTQDILLDIANRFEGLADGQQKTAAAIDLFSRSGEKWIPLLNQGADAMQRMRQQGGLINAVDASRAEEFNDTLTRIKQNLQNIFITVSRDVLPALQKLASRFEAMASGGSIKSILLTVVMEFGKGLAIAVTHVAELFGELFITAAGEIGKALNSALESAVNRVANFFNKSGTLARLLGGSIPNMNVSGINAAQDKQTAEQIAAMHAGAAIFRDKVTEFFNTGIAAAKNLYGHSPESVATSSANPGANSGTINGAPIVSDEAKKLILDIDKAYADSTQSRIALLNIEEQELKNRVDQEITDRTKAEEEKTKITAIYAGKRADIERQAADAKAQIQLAQVSAQRQAIDTDPLLTKAQKAQKALPILAAEQALTKEAIALNERRVADATLSPEAQLDAQKQLVDLRAKDIELLREQQALLGENSMSFQFGAALVAIQDQWGSWAIQLATNFSDVFNSAIQTISEGISGLILGTKTWGQALRQIGLGLINEITMSIVRMGVQFIATHLIMRGVMMATAAIAEALHAKEIAQSIRAFAASSAAGAGKSGEQGGWVGVLIYMAVMAAAIAGLSAMAGGFAEGGYTGDGGKYQFAGAVHKGEYVMPADKTAKFRPFLEAMHRGRELNFAAPESTRNPVMMDGGSAPVSNTTNSGPTEVAVGFFDDRQQLRQFLESNAGKQIILKHVRDGRVDLGFDT